MLDVSSETWLELDDKAIPESYAVLQEGFFLLLAARVRSSCEEGPGQSALQSA